jgi:hypothetical protein
MIIPILAATRSARICSAVPWDYPRDCRGELLSASSVMMVTSSPRGSTDIMKMGFSLTENRGHEIRRGDLCINVIEIFPNRLTKPKTLDIKPIAGFL